MKSISTDTSRPLVLTEEDYEDIIASMPGGMNGFLKSWGLLQFAAAVEDRLLNAIPARRLLEALKETGDADTFSPYN